MHNMNRLKNKRKVEEGSKIFDAYFGACENDNLDTVVVFIGGSFGFGGKIMEYPCFKWNEKTFAVTGYDHYNGHFSGYTNRADIFELYIAEVVFE